MKNSDLIPRDKHDLERVEALIKAGPQAALPILESLLGCIQDINWPIAPPIADFLVRVGPPLTPHLKKVLASGDDMWIYWVLKNIVAFLPKDQLQELSRPLEELATTAENDMIAIEIGVGAGIWAKDRLKVMVARKIVAYEIFLVDLKKIQAGLN